MPLTDDERSQVRAELAALREKQGTERFYVALWSYVPDTDDDDHLASLAPRFRYLQELADRGFVWGSGPLRPERDELEGMTILTVDSFEAARALLDREPTVVRGLRTYTLVSWDRSILP